VPWGRVIAIAAAVFGVLWFMLDSGWLGAPAPLAMSASLAGLGVVFGAGAAVMWFGGRPERTPQYAGLAIAVLLYALVRLQFVTD
jgi:hypothetical protein